MIHRLRVLKHRRYVQSQINLGMDIGQNVGIMPGVKFDPPHSFLTSIGNNVIIAPNVRFLNHDASAFVFNKTAKIGKIIIYDNCFIGAGVILLPGIEIGPNAIIGAGSIVTKSIPPYSIAAGCPANVINSIEPLLDKKIMDDKFVIHSKDFYPQITDKSFMQAVKKNIGLYGYTIGSDGNVDYYFNIE